MHNLCINAIVQNTISALNFTPSCHHTTNYDTILSNSWKTLFLWIISQSLPSFNFEFFLYHCLLRLSAKFLSLWELRQVFNLFLFHQSSIQWEICSWNHIADNLKRKMASFNKHHSILMLHPNLQHMIATFWFIYD